MGGYVMVYGNKKYVYQVDSFKLWEAFMSGCCVIAIDFQRFGIQLPVDLINGVHYIGITDDGDEVEQLLQNIQMNKLPVEQIAKAGKQWVLQHYCPEAIAQYILSVVSDVRSVFKIIKNDD